MCLEGNSKRKRQRERGCRRGADRGAHLAYFERGIQDSESLRALSLLCLNVFASSQFANNAERFADNSDINSLHRGRKPTALFAGMPHATAEGACKRIVSVRGNEHRRGVRSGDRIGQSQTPAFGRYGQERLEYPRGIPARERQPSQEGGGCRGGDAVSPGAAPRKSQPVHAASHIVVVGVLPGRYRARRQKQLEVYGPVPLSLCLFFPPEAPT